jgi:hypothetical protein
MKTFFNAIARLAESLRYGFCRLTEIQFDAPWAERRSRCG